MVKVYVPSLTPVNSNTTDKLNQITLCCGNSPVHYKMSGITSSLHLSTPAPAPCPAVTITTVFRCYQMPPTPENAALNPSGDQLKAVLSGLDSGGERGSEGGTWSR